MTTINLRSLYETLRYIKLRKPEHPDDRTRFPVRSRIDLLNNEYPLESCTEYTMINLVAVRYRTPDGTDMLEWEMEI